MRNLKHSNKTLSMRFRRFEPTFEGRETKPDEIFIMQYSMDMGTRNGLRVVATRGGKRKARVEMQLTPEQAIELRNYLNEVTEIA